MAHNYTQLRVSGINLAASNPGFSQRLTGKVTNTGPQVAHVDAVTAAFYNARGRLVYVADQGLLYPWSAKQDLRSRQTAPFADDVLGYLKKPARIVMYVRAERQP